MNSSRSYMQQQPFQASGKPQVTTNNYGFGNAFLKNVSKKQKISTALRGDPKVQRRYM